jgi:hypothetical protein
MCHLVLFIGGTTKSGMEGFSLRYQAVFSVLVAGFLTLSCVRVSSECVPRPGCKVTSNVLARGSYEVVFVATHGSKAGHSTIGKLVLRTSAPGDVSPRTREPVAESERHRLYGSIEFKFGEIGAPICIGDTLVPAPNSTDPVYPGVLVHEYSEEKGGGVILTIGALSNLRDDLRTGVVWLDDPGVALFVHCLTPTEFSGTWGAWGILTDGSGYFCARRKSTD